jgi:hypothetical protein
MYASSDAQHPYFVVRCSSLGVFKNINWVNIFSNDQYTLFEHNQKRSAHCNDNEGILAFFTGILVHDHFKAYYKNKAATHAECNQHILRYLKAVIEIQDHLWAKQMTEFLLAAKNLKAERVASGESVLPPAELAEQGAHFIKNKTRVAGGFRSHQGADDHMAIASVIATAKKQKKNLFSMIKDSAFFTSSWVGISGFILPSPH